VTARCQCGGRLVLVRVGLTDPRPMCRACGLPEPDSGELEPVDVWADLAAEAETGGLWFQAHSTLLAPPHVLAARIRAHGKDQP
jgi:hypothetical protein